MNLQLLHALFAELARRNVRYALIGVWGVNMYANSPSLVFTTHDQDLFLPLDADNLLEAWRACEAIGLDLVCASEPLDIPRDHWLARRVVAREALTRATDRVDMHVDLTLVMAGFDFERVWRDRRVFVVDGVDVPVARLLHIIESKAAAGRLKDHAFFATHEHGLKEMLAPDPMPPLPPRPSAPDGD
jgi:hypothetical protein